MYKKTALAALLFFGFSLLHADYTLKPSKRLKSKIDHMPKGKVADMRNIPQNPSYYAKQIKPYSKSKQQKLYNKFKEKYFKPWTLHKLDVPKTDYGWEIRFITKNKIYRENGRIIPSYIYKKWIHNAQMHKVDSKGFYAITTRHTDVKALPTSTSFYKDPRHVGEGFPFDYNQNSALHINIPLYISHYSKDRRWAYVRASYSSGWVKITDLALVDHSFIKQFKTGNYAITIKDNLRLYDEKNKPISLVKLGALFPIEKGTYLTTKQNSLGHSSIHKVHTQNTHIISKMPLPFTSRNVASLAKEFYGEPYGWGGKLECRDCSATTRDFLAPFGIFLRRNSSKQAKDGTRNIYIKGLSKKAKKRKIISNAEPFRSLLYVPGHIVLYLGQYKGEPVIMHTYWGIRKKNGSKIITGRTIITSTEPGKERSDVKESSKLINTLKTIVKF